MTDATKFTTLTLDQQADVHRWAMLYAMFPEKWDCGGGDTVEGRATAAAMKVWSAGGSSYNLYTSQKGTEDASEIYEIIRRWVKEDHGI